MRLIPPALASTLLSIDLRSDWVNSSVVIESISKPSNVPDLVQTGLWYNQASNTIYGGFAGRRSTISDSVPSQYPLSIYSFKPDGAGSGTFDTVVDSAGWGSNTRPLQGAIAFSNDTGYVLGGCATSDTSLRTADYQSPVALDGLLTFDMTSQKLSNISATGYNGNGTVEYATMEYVAPFGPQGLFVVLGGDQPPNTIGDSGEDNFVPFTSVSVYEPSSNKWYQQPTSGNIPEPRKEFCTAGVASTNETYEIFLYAGWGGNLGSVAVPYDEIFILTLPAFTWVKVNYPPKSPRHALSCNAVGGSQIVTIGGLNSASADTNGVNVYIDAFNASDPFANGLNIFDMTTLSFATKYTANPPTYTQSSLVAAVYDANPQTQYNSPALAKLMSQKNFNAATMGISSGSGSNSTTNSTSNPSGPAPAHKSSSTGAIVGGVVGGVAALLLLAAATFFFLRRRRSRQQQQHQPLGASAPAMAQERDAGAYAFPGNPNAAGYYAPPGDRKYQAYTTSPPAPEQPPQELASNAEPQEVVGDTVAAELESRSPTVRSSERGERVGSGEGGSVDGGSAGGGPYVPAAKRRSGSGGGWQWMRTVGRTAGGQSSSGEDDLYGVSVTDGSAGGRGSEHA
ncbi:MAG: hypothetical protein M1822_000253 [Bathelium mastoideum]|nr:MAG: hypothetical protein M1822_000253 [Bathelium mastoideum]